tara:strand:- start:1499 stop:2035 length:537 start_codon:yes stop_codon:yes gene_type:complete
VFLVWHKSCSINIDPYSTVKKINSSLKLTPKENRGMEAFEGFQDKEFDLLNEAILKAIVSSPDVENVLQYFKSKDLINEMAVVNLILSLEELSGLMFPEGTDKSTQAIDSPSENRLQKIKNPLVGNTQKEIPRKPNNHYLVDGKLLNRNEILFEKHFQGRFNEKQWLKRAKIKTIEKL